MKRIVVCAVGLSLAFGALADNLREVVVAAGAEPLAGYNDILNSSQDVAKRAFDGVCTNALGDNARCLGGANMFVTFGYPDSLVGTGKKLAVTRYRVYQLNGGTSCHARAPRAWNLKGSTDNSTYVDVDVRSDVEWYADSHTIGADAALPAGVDNWLEYELAPSVTTDYRYFKYQPTASKMSSGWKYVFEEVEFYGTVYDPADGYCEVRMPERPIGSVTPGYGAVTPTGAVFRVASRVVEYQGTDYTLKGWKLEKWQDSAWVTAASGTEDVYTYVPDGSICRFSWEWQVGECFLTTSVRKDVGCETVTCSPASATGAYAAGTVVTITANPAATPYASSFVRWLGDLPATVDPTSPVIQVTMDASRSIEAVFDRTGWGWVFTPAGQAANAGALTDGSWKFRVLETTEDGFTGAMLAEIVFGDGLLDLRTVKADTGLRLLSITNDLFRSNATITGVKFNNELRRTGSYAFSGASALTSVEFGTDLTTFGDRTFNGSRLAGTVDMSVCTNVTVINNETFFNCNYIEELVLPPRLRNVGWRPIASMNALKSIRCSSPGPWWGEMKKQSFSWGSDIIGGAPLLETIELPCGGTLPLGLLRGLPKLKTLKLNGKAPASVGTLFSAWSTIQPQPAYQLQIVVSSQRDREGWEALKTRAPTDEEKLRADYPGPNTFGVLDAPDSSRAWMVWGRSMFDVGLSIIFR